MSWMWAGVFETEGSPKKKEMFEENPRLNLSCNGASSPLNLFQIFYYKETRGEKLQSHLLLIPSH